MKMTLGIVLVSFCLLFGGTAIAADQNELPPILASLDHSEDVILLDDHSMKEIQGTSFVSWRDAIKARLAPKVTKIKRVVRVVKQKKDQIRRRVIRWFRARLAPPCPG